MITMRTAFTHEVDDTDQALADILNQLDCGNSLLAQSVGLVTCHPEFVDSGVVEALCARLPFPVVGTTTLGSATNEVADTYVLVLTVLTSDLVHFSCVLTDSLADEQEGPLRDAYARSVAALPEKLSLALVYGPMLSHVGGGRLVRVLDAIAPGLPQFGTLTCDHNYDFHEARVIFDGRAYRDREALVLLSGPVAPRFYTVFVPEADVGKQHAVVTASEGNVLKEVNNQPVLAYLESLGLSREAGLEGSKTIPIIINLNDGTPPVAGCFYMISDQGHVICGDAMPVNATFSLGSLGREQVMLSVEELFGRIRLDASEAGSGHAPSGMLIISCIGRSVSLGTDQMAEAERIRELAQGGMPMHLCYSGGEIGPVYEPGGGTANRFHNFSCTVCVFS